MDGAAGTTSQTPIGGPIFADAVQWVIDVAEGGARIVQDQGGVTKFGISKRAYPHLDPATLTREQAVELYLRDYWHPIRGAALPPALALALFDSAVNMGPQTATKILQGALRVAQDGVMGPDTVAAAKLFLPRAELVARFLELRLRWYEELAAKYQHHRASIYGWRMRVMRLALEAGRWRGL